MAMKALSSEGTSNSAPDNAVVIAPSLDEERRQHERPSGRGCPAPGSRHRDIICHSQTLAAQEPDATAELDYPHQRPVYRLLYLRVRHVADLAHGCRQVVGRHEEDVDVVHLE